mmetsp:Transcript_89772/g.231774  ORF Transcript_89772/g.231774 Transcript_89772/m.231774 type:complete len:230 (-) Transcript_89772:985-1674(-)
MPRLQRTRAISLICDKLIVDNPADRPPPPSAQTIKKMPIQRTISTTSTTTTTVPIVSQVGAGSCTPMPARKRVMKKSRMYLIRRLNSALYGNVASATPEISAASSALSPMKGSVAKQHMKKHHASEMMSMSSTEWEATRRTAGITNFAYSNAMTTNTATMPKFPKMLRGCGSESSVWIMNRTMAQRSWKMRIFTVSFPGAESMSACMLSNFTTRTVEEIAVVVPQYSAA